MGEVAEADQEAIRLDIGQPRRAPRKDLGQRDEIERIADFERGLADTVLLGMG